MLSVGTQNEKLHKVSQSRKRLIRKSVSVNGLADRSFESSLMLAPSSPSFNLFTLKSSSALNVRWNSNQYGFPPLPLVIAGPSGSGKSTLLNRLKDEFQDCCALSISHTTRKPRPGETNGKEYFFVDTDTFEQSIQNEEFIEFTRFANNYYGTSKKSVLDVQNSGKICLLDVEMDGVKNLKKTDLNPRFVFIKPPSMEILEQRLRNRGTESDESLKRRLDRAIEELRFGEVQGIFDLTITNHNVDEAYKILRGFIGEDIEKLKKSRGM